MRRDAIDINAWGGPRLLSIVPETDRGERWCAEHINANPHNGAYLSEHRYGPDILKAAHDQGLTVALDGKVCDTPREFRPCAGCPDGRICARMRECFYVDEVEGRG